MTLRELVGAMEGAAAGGTVLDAPVRGLVLDSRRVAPGDVFFALPGAKADGTRFAEAAAAAGALAIVGPRGLRVPDAPVIEVAEPRLALAQAACVFHGRPSQHALRVVAVTGTNGKTTTTWMLAAVFEAAGWIPGVIGTTGIRIDRELRASAFTTPEAPELQALLAEMRTRGVQAVAMEASSHALAQRRTWGLACDVAIFTNLTLDHLDYHGTMDAYLDAKLMLFDGRNGPRVKPTTAVVNAFDPAADRVIDAARRGGAEVFTFGGEPDRIEPRVDLHVERITPIPEGLELQLRHHGRTRVLGVASAGERRFRLHMFGAYNAANAAGAWLAATALGVAPDVADLGLQSFLGVPGRLERVDAGQPFTVLVDYAHTPDALARALTACREHTRARVLCVFGCGGDRDRGKRPQMGAIAARLADRAWVTNDNPRSEDPGLIAAEIVAGAPAAGLVTILDRRGAIAAALAAAKPGDIVLLAGKGHETTQTIGTQVVPFDDRVVAREALEAAR